MPLTYPNPLVDNDIINIGLQPATTTNSNDSIKISGGEAALSTNNIGWVNIMDASTGGRLKKLYITADVTINLTGAHWGAGTKGDLSSSAFLRVYAINDNGTLKWGVGYVGSRRTVVNTDTSTTGTSVTSPEMLLVNSALTAGTWPCREVGFFYASFDDTGGAAEDLWAVQTAVGNLIVGRLPDGIWQPFNITETGFSADQTWSYTRWCQSGKSIIAEGIRNVAGTSNATTVTVELPVKASDVFYGTTYNNVDNGSGVNQPGVAATRAASTTCDLYKNGLLAAWTNVNGKATGFKVTYQAN